MNTIKLLKDKKIYFTSDHHFGAPNRVDSKLREKKFIKWLEEIRKDAQVLFILGDLFDFWFEYKYVIPKGFTRVIGKLAELSDQGIEIHFFVGNHDIKVYHKPHQFKLNNKEFFIGHGDGLGPKDRGYKRLKKIFTNTFFRWVYRWIHPDIGVRFAQYLSLKNKLISGNEDLKFQGEEKEWLALYAKRKLKERHRDYFIFGHRHIPMEIKLNENSTYINLGDWVSHYTYATFDGSCLELKKWKVK